MASAAACVRNRTPCRRAREFCARRKILSHSLTIQPWRRFGRQIRKVRSRIFNRCRHTPEAFPDFRSAFRNMLVTCAEMKSAEEAAFARGVQAEDLMEQAGRGVAEIVRQFHSRPGLCSVFCGKGHNAWRRTGRGKVSFWLGLGARFAVCLSGGEPVCARC